MSVKLANNYAYIDGTNLYKGIDELGWKLNYRRFRVWLSEKYGVSKAYIFLGFVVTNSGLYRDIQNCGYTIIFKPTIRNSQGELKGNCDAELVLQAVSDMYEQHYEKAIIVTGDGDFACLINFLSQRNRLRAVLSPNHKKASVLLRKAAPNNILFLERFRNMLEYKKDKDGDQK